MVYGTSNGPQDDAGNYLREREYVEHELHLPFSGAVVPTRGLLTGACGVSCQASLGDKLEAFWRFRV